MLAMRKYALNVHFWMCRRISYLALLLAINTKRQIIKKEFDLRCDAHARIYKSKRNVCMYAYIQRRLAFGWLGNRQDETGQSMQKTLQIFVTSIGKSSQLCILFRKRCPKKIEINSKVVGVSKISQIFDKNWTNFLWESMIDLRLSLIVESADEEWLKIPPKHFKCIRDEITQFRFCTFALFAQAGAKCPTL